MRGPTIVFSIRVQKKRQDGPHLKAGVRPRFPQFIVPLQNSPRDGGNFKPVRPDRFFRIDTKRNPLSWGPDADRRLARHFTTLTLTNWRESQGDIPHTEAGLGALWA
ncbi:MAG: hypothetical protein CM15mP25_3400 [Gammaproteobacteria bacterium]|nr:MAG: hypothetical protein CM15mP25_3400 [Gammaproteobacteria bacterium]